MNLFKVFASGKQSFREEFVSAFFAYLLAPNMDHGLGSSFFSLLVQRIGEITGRKKIQELAQGMADELRTDFFNEDNGQVEIDIEFRYDMPKGKSGFVDIVARYKSWYFLIENKIQHASLTKNQLREQYRGVRERLKQIHSDGLNILQIYLVPALPGINGWSNSQGFLDELPTDYEGEDLGVVVYWQEPVQENELSVLAVLKEILEKEANGEISPLAYDTKQVIRSFINFCLSEFSGYRYTRRKPSQSIEDAERFTVSELLGKSEELYVGVQYGRAGLIIKAWRYAGFKDETLKVSTVPKGWQYLSLPVFQKICTWAMNPDHNNLKGLEWNGKPFGAVNMYRVAKTAGDDIYIGLRGGLTKLAQMSTEDFFGIEMWEVSNSPKSANWFSGREYCRVVEEKNIRSIIDEA